jgi:uncharacterized protein
MAMSQSQIRDNPWWKAPAAVATDPDLIRLEEQVLRFEHPLPFDLDTDAVYTLRGPRQVGKSTLLKRIARHLLMDRGVLARNILYFDVEGAGINTPLRLQNAVTSFLDWSRTSDPAGRKFLLLDEVTGVRDWGTFVRVLYRQGLLANVTVIVTGSHALDLKRGSETAPGRRGERSDLRLDWIMMPLSFRDFVRAHRPDVAAAIPEINVFDPRSAYDGALELALHADVLVPLFDRYLLTGGYPHAMAMEHGSGRIPASVYTLYRQAINGQMKRAGHRETLFREIVSWAADGRLGREFSWRGISAETDVGAKETARTYVEDAEAMFLWHVYQRSQGATESAAALRSPKKLYPADPFPWHVLASWAAGERDPWAGSLTRLANPSLRGELVESVAGDHFKRRFGAFALYHRAPQGEEEIDFVLHWEGDQARIEAKYRKRIVSRESRWLAKYGGGILATVDELEWSEEQGVARIPLHALLAGFAEPITLFPGGE